MGLAKNPRKPLTQRALDFCKLYVENGYNGRRAYMEAYKNPNEATAQVGAHQLLKDPRVQNEIAFMEGTYKSLSYKVGLTKETVVKAIVEMMKATKVIIHKDGTREEVPDWFARNMAVNQYAKLTGDFNEKDINKKIKEAPSLQEEVTIKFNELSKEDLDIERRKLMESLISA